VCGVGGDVVQFVKLYKKCTTIEAVKIIGEMINFDFTNHQDIFNNTQFDEKTKHLYDSIKASNDFYVASLFDKTNLNVLQYLKKRGIDEEIIKYFKIGYAPNTNILNKILTNKNDMFGRDYNKNLI
jgi:DNA primase